jgi:hypothetical protein
MSTEIASIEQMVATGRKTSGGLYLFMGVLFLGVVLLGFLPNTIATLSGQVPLIGRPIVHLHAVTMGSWLLLFLAQTILMASERKRLHQQLGLASMVLAAAMFAVMLVITTARYGQLVELAHGTLANPAGDVTPEFLGRRMAFVLFIQGRAVVLFGLFYAWAVLVRRSAPETHKRMMILATLVVVDAALGRMSWLPGHTGVFVAADAGYDAIHLYQLLLMAPAVGYDLLKRQRVHHAYVVGLGLFLLFSVATHVAWNSTWWQRAVATHLGMAA